MQRNKVSLILKSKYEGTWPVWSGTALSLPRLNLRHSIVTGIITLVSFSGACAYAAELSWQDAISQAWKNHPQVVTVIKAEEAAKRAEQKATGAFGPQVTFDSTPLNQGTEITRSTPVEYSKGDARIIASLTTPLGIGASAVLSHNWTDNKHTANTGVVLSASAALDPEGVLYNSARISLVGVHHGVQKAGIDRAVTLRNVAIDTLSTFWQLEIDAQRVAVAQETLQDRSDNYKRVQQRRQAGMANETDVITAQIELLQADAALQKQQADYNARQATFAANLNISTLPPLKPSGGANQNELVQDYNNAGMELAARANDPTAWKHRLDLEMAELELQQAQAALLPNVKLSTNYQLPDLSNINDKASRPWGVMLDIELPLTDGAKRQLTLRDKQVALESITNTLRRDLDAAAASMRAKLVDWDQARRAVEIARLKLEKARLEESLKTEQQRDGLVNQSSLAAIQRSSRLAQIDWQAAVNAQRLVELEISSISGGELSVAGQALIPSL